MIPGLRHRYSVSDVNGYCGCVLFENTNGVFLLVGEAYILQYTSSRTSCSMTGSALHLALYDNILPREKPIDDAKYRESIFNIDESPGRAYYRVKPDLKLECEDGKLLIQEEDILLLEERAFYLPSEDSLTRSMVKCLGKKQNLGLELLDTTQIKSEFSPFSGGGDIAFFYADKSALIQTRLDPNSPTDDDEAKFSFSCELIERSCDDVTQQLLANMIVVAAMSLEKMCRNKMDKVRTMKHLSTYGLTMDLNLPLQLYKLTINFDKSSVDVHHQLSSHSDSAKFLCADRLITYMIRNISHT